MYIEPHILLILIVGAIVLYLTNHTKANKYRYLSWGIEDLVTYIRRLNYGNMFYHDFVYDNEIKDYFLVLYDKEFYPITIKLNSVSEFELDRLYKETNKEEQKKIIINLISREISYRKEWSEMAQNVVKYDDYCSDELNKKLEHQILSKKTHY